jgi:hypothetical protein
MSNLDDTYRAGDVRPSYERDAPDQPRAAARMVEDPDPATPEIEPQPNYANKAIVALVTLVVGFGAQWALSKGFDIDQEGITAALVAIVTGLVYKVSNQENLLGD